MNPANANTSDINALLTNDNFSKEVVAQLEDYVSSLLTEAVRTATPSSSYHAGAIRRLMKLYQFHPSTRKNESIAQTLFLTLLQYPEHTTDMLALQYMIPTPTRGTATTTTTAATTDETCDLVLACWKYLDKCQFSQFWEYYAQLASPSSSLKDFITAQTKQTFQGGILQALALTYKEASSTVVMQALQADSIDTVQGFASIVESVTSDKDDGIVVFVPTTDNTKRQRAYQESLNFTSISALMNKIVQ